MRSTRHVALKVLCALGLLALLIPLVVYAAGFSLWVGYIPDGGSGPPIYSSFTWNWNVLNTHTYSISASADPETARLKREVAWWFDETVLSGNPGTVYSGTIAPGESWGDHRNIGGWVMSSGNNYYWQWDSWSSSANCGHSSTYNSGTGAKYTCN
jgi:hypothetical protein